MKVVFDAGVVYAGAGWRGEAYLALVALARRRVTAYATVATLEELRDLVRTRAYKCRHNPHTILDWYYRAVRLADAAPLGKQRSRDWKDDPYLACALGANAKWIVSRDGDLLALQRPLGSRSSRRTVCSPESAGAGALADGRGVRSRSYVHQGSAGVLSACHRESGAARAQMRSESSPRGSRPFASIRG